MEATLKGQSDIRPVLSPEYWVIQLIERIVYYRNELGVHVFARGQNAAKIEESLFLRTKERIWSFQANIDFTGFSKKYHANQCVFVLLDCEINMDYSIFHEIPKGALVVSLWKIQGEFEMLQIKKKLKLYQPLWSESLMPLVQNTSRYGLLAYSQEIPLSLRN